MRVVADRAVLHTPITAISVARRHKFDQLLNPPTSTDIAVIALCRNSTISTTRIRWNMAGPSTLAYGAASWAINVQRDRMKADGALVAVPAVILCR